MFSYLPAAASDELLPFQQDTSFAQTGFLSQNDARQYMLDLINRDRATVGAPPVVLDALGTRAGQAHSDEMAMNGYLSHWTMDGRKPDQRYNDVGGKDAVAENVFVLRKGHAVVNSAEPIVLPLSSDRVFNRNELNRIESAFFGEKPPNDGHRQNIINPCHTSVGIALSVAASPDLGARTAVTQEFINHYGDYGDIPKSVRIGERFTLSGRLNRGIHLKSIDLRWEELRHTIERGAAQ